MISGSEAPAVVLQSDYNDKPSLQESSKVSTMYDWAKGVGAKVEKGYTELDEVKVKQSREDRIRIKRQRKMVDQVLGVVRENMINLRITPQAMFAEFDEDGSGDMSFWEFTKGCEKLGVKLSDGRMEMVMRSLDQSGRGFVSLSDFEHALALNQCVHRTAVPLLSTIGSKLPIHAPFPVVLVVPPRFRSAPPRSPDEWTPMDPLWNKIYHALGAPDAVAISRTFDPDDVGAVGLERFIEILKVRAPPRIPRRP